MAKGAVDRALELAPEAAEAHLALGYYHYWCHREYERALEAFAIAEKGLPNDAELLEAIAYVRRRQGRWGAAVDNLKKAIELNPMDAGLALELGITYQFLRKYPDAVRYYEQSIGLAPDQIFTYLVKALTYRAWKGTTEDARAALEAMPKTDDPGALLAWFWQEIYEGKYREALQRLSSLSVDLFQTPDGFESKALLSAQAYELLNEPQLARSAYESARVVLEKEALARPDDYRLHSSLGVALAGLGRKDEAIQEGKLATELYPVSKDAVDGTIVILDLALVYTMVGEHDAALDQIEYLLSIPSWISVRRLQLDPRFQPLREHPRFQKLVDRYG